ncbi:MAG: hypothetical protein NVS3B7_09870 [Candidatus Elarobacter sp.]
MKNLTGVVTLAVLSCALLAPAAARADVFASNTADFHASSLGYGAAVGHTIAPLVDLRIASGTLAFERRGTTDNLNYTGSVRLRNIAALLDLHPTNGAFRVTTGLVFGNDRIDVHGTAQNGTYVINGNTYTSSQVGTVDGTAKLGSAAPYLGIGLGAPHRLGIYPTVDVGVAFRSVTSTLNASGPATASAQFQSDLAKARSDFQKSVGVLKTYPVISFGLASRF